MSKKMNIILLLKLIYVEKIPPDRIFAPFVKNITSKGTFAHNACKGRTYPWV